MIFTRNFAGSERYAVELANAQSSNHQVIFMLSPAGAESRIDALANRISPAVQIIVLKSRIALFQRFECRRLLRDIQPDIAHAHLSTACRALSGIKSTFLRIATLHIHYKKQQHAKLDCLIAIAPWQLDSIPEPLAKHTKQIDNWTAPKTSGKAEVATLKREYGIAQDAFVFGTIGRVVDSKGMDTLVQAFEKAAIVNSRLVIVGSGKAWEKVNKLASTGVLMPGFSANPENWLACFDCFVSAARSEPFGLVFLEAMASGLPIIATASQGAQHLNLSMNASLVPIDDISALAGALIDMSQKKPARRIYDLSRFSLVAKLIEIEDFYRAELQLKRGN